VAAVSAPQVNPTHYGDPAGGCMSDEMNVTIDGITGDLCSPQCDASGNCPTDLPPNVTVPGQCVLEMPGNSNPTYCALICDPTQKQCGTATCQPIQGVGVCTYAN